MWARQVLIAMSGLHARGIVVACLELEEVQFGGDGSVLLNAIKLSGRNFWNRKRKLPPGLRNEGVVLLTRANFRTDIFQLEHFLWRLVEHTATYGNPVYCPRNACISSPRWGCTLDHTNPIGLPLCTEPEAPKWINTVIDHCMQSNPDARLPARDLLPYFADQRRPSELEVMAELKEFYIAGGHVLCAHCDEFGRFNTHEHYHCNVYFYGNFDLCSDCISNGVHCFVPQYQLEKRRLKIGSIATVI